MNNLLHHLNQALFETNRLVIRYLAFVCLATVGGLVGGGVFVFLPFFLINNQQFATVWPGLALALWTYLLISLLVYYTRRLGASDAPEEEIVHEGEANGFQIVRTLAPPPALSLPESFRIGLRWTLLAYAILAALAFGLSGLGYEI
jgi:hypothetical protein